MDQGWFWPRQIHQGTSNSLLEGAPGPRPAGLTENDSAAEEKAWKQILKKREKQRRYRNNVKRTNRQEIKPKHMIDNTCKQYAESRNVFYVRNNKAINRRRKIIRAAWREYKSAVLSQRARKAGKGHLKKNQTWNKKQLFSNNKIRNEIKEQTKKWYSKHKTEVKRQFKFLQQQQSHLKNTKWTKRQNKKYTYTNANNFDQNKTRIERNTNLKN